MNFESENISIKELIKMLLLSRGMSMNKLVQILHETKGFSSSYSNLFGKLQRGTIKFDEVKEIAKILDYSIVFKDNKN
jgi:hypothetical protein